jgi:hypothetical protein
MDKIKQNIDLQEAIQRYNKEKSVVGTLAYSIEQNIQKGMSVDEAIENVLQKSKKANVGEVHTWNGKKFKKQANGKWLEVSEYGMTKEEHENKGKHSGDSSYKHTLISDKLSDKEYSDEEVTGGEKKEAKKLSPKSIYPGDSYMVYDAGNPDAKPEKVKIISRKRDEGGYFDVEVEYENGEKDKWYLSDEDFIFEKI